MAERRSILGIFDHWKGSALLCLLAGVAGAEEPGYGDACQQGLMSDPICIGSVALACMAETGPGSEGPCFGEETALWEERLAQAVARLEAAGARAEEFAERVGWPEPRPSMEAVQEAFHGYREATCNMEAAFWGNGSGAGEVWQACLMRITAAQAFRLESWLEVAQ